ncbi:MAG: nickel pincer cofactor biosynthesis protein LarB [Lachnospiraceae bacterium]|jgi:NCAIR mutase (PurE)-related protein|nr:nickel pincer cofactor biosynthesis protein LarB [Lachnospiraceae bacterium]
MNVTELLQQVKEGSLSIEEAEKQLKKLPYEDLGFAKLDHHRKLRQGFEEVIYCSGKATEHLVKIYQTLTREGVDVLGTRASREQYEAVGKEVPEVVYDPIARILKVEKRKKEYTGKIVVCTGGTADVPVAEEAAQTAEFFGTRVVRLFDVGVAGIHRLLSNMKSFEGANCVVAVAGMEGALAGVVAGLVDVPVIAVPTSVGYGASFHGLSALLTMLNSCANGITVVNIDNGYGAAYVATQINRLAVGSPEKAQEG